MARAMFGRLSDWVASCRLAGLDRLLEYIFEVVENLITCPPKGGEAFQRLDFVRLGAAKKRWQDK